MNTVDTLFCQLCMEKEGTIMIQECLFNEISEHRFCEECAMHIGLINDMRWFPGSMNFLLEPLLNGSDTRIGDKAHMHCMHCHTTRVMIICLGMVGCAHCYEEFKDTIQLLLGDTSQILLHHGKIPRKVQRYKKLMIDKQQLETKLAHAVQHEDYEHAGVLQKMLDEMDSIHDNNGT